MVKEQREMTHEEQVLDGLELALLCKDGKGLTLKDQTWSLDSDCADNTAIHPKFGSVWTTGRWKMSRETVQSLVGKKLILVPSTHKSSYLGGEIIGYTEVDDGRFELTFRSSEDLRNRRVIGWRSQNPICLIKNLEKNMFGVVR